MFLLATWFAAHSAAAKADLDAIPTGTIAPFEAGDVIAYLGDSITCGGTYHKYIHTYWITRYPDTRLRYVNKGIFSDFRPEADSLCGWNRTCYWKTRTRYSSIMA